MPSVRTHEQALAAYLTKMVECGEFDAFLEALGHIARAHGLAAIARDSGLGRESLYKALSAKGNPEFATVLKVIHALGLKLKVAA